ncbi:MAG TPA: tRNA (adenosine(37)-N6)-dimethylallyltransferase MiaA [Chryseosolibacter sp.]|nr:tRNA (adenosine(37)-N6)-dimethylallyltransferase MiaA [Chryseosolibacter sp.]
MIHKLLIVIAGPTAVGKTALAIELAKKYGTEIISADSRQFYRELNIGTAKPVAGELDAVRHHFINSHSITENYDAAAFGKDALSLINDLFLQYDKVIMCGGSGLYIKAVCEGFDEIPEAPDEIRERLNNDFEFYGITWLQQQILEHDPEIAELIDMRNPHRMVRALEVKLATGRSILAFRKHRKQEHPFRITKIGLDLPREILYDRIDRRMDEMISAGLFIEARNVYDFRNMNALQTVGYQEIFGFFENQYDYDETVRLLKRNSRRYAKRQLTWFKRDPEFRWFNPINTNDITAYIDSFANEIG